MNITELPYPLRLCTESLHYCVWHSETMKGKKCGEIRQYLVDAFGDKIVDDAFKVLMGEYELPNV